MGKHLFWYPRDIEAYARDTQHLTVLEHGVYTLLLDQYYRAKGRVWGRDSGELKRICRCSTPAEVRALNNIRDSFFHTGEDGFLINHRADEEIKKSFEISSKRQAAVNKRWADVHAHEDTNVIPPTPTPTSTPKSKTNAHASRERSPSSVKTLIPNGFTVSDEVREWAKKKAELNPSAHYHSPGDHLEHFVAQSEKLGRKYANWDAAFKTAIRMNWAKIPPKLAMRL